MQHELHPSSYLWSQTESQPRHPPAPTPPIQTADPTRTHAADSPALRGESAGRQEIIHMVSHRGVGVQCQPERSAACLLSPAIEVIHRTIIPRRIVQQKIAKAAAPWSPPPPLASPPPTTPLRHTPVVPPLSWRLPTSSHVCRSLTRPGFVLPVSTFVCLFVFFVVWVHLLFSFLSFLEL